MDQDLTTTRPAIGQNLRADPPVMQIMRLIDVSPVGSGEVDDSVASSLHPDAIAGKLAKASVRR